MKVGSYIRIVIILLYYNLWNFIVIAEILFILEIYLETIPDFNIYF